jgi:NAD(P)-dependent dehydrogenase (short-subunit alcohol dehydrogenase family)
LDLQHEKAQTGAEQLRSEGLNIQGSYLDISDSPDVNRVFDDVVKEHGRLDVLVNNAGVGQTMTATIELSDEEWDRILKATEE